MLVIWKLLWDASPLWIAFREPIPACHRLWTLPRAGFSLISSFSQESEEGRWRDDTGICSLTPGLHGPAALALAMISSDWMEQFQIPVGTCKSHGPAGPLPWPEQPQLGRWHPGQCMSHLWIIPWLAQSPVWLKEQVSSLPSSWESLAAPAEMEDPHHLPELLAWPRHPLPSRIVPVSQMPLQERPCPARRPLQLSWEHDGLWDSSLIPSTASSQRLCPQNHFQITLERDELSPTQPEAGPWLHLFKQDSQFWCLSPSSAPFLWLHNIPSFREGDTSSFPMSCVAERSALGAAPAPTPAPSLGHSQAPTHFDQD